MKIGDTVRIKAFHSSRFHGKIGEIIKLKISYNECGCRHLVRLEIPIYNKCEWSIMESDLELVERIQPDFVVNSAVLKG